MVRALAGDVTTRATQQITQSVAFGLIVFGVVHRDARAQLRSWSALDVRVEEGRSLTRQVRERSCPCSPGELAVGAARGDPGASRTRALGLPVLFGSIWSCC